MISQNLERNRKADKICSYLESATPAPIGSWLWSWQDALAQQVLVVGSHVFPRLSVGGEATGGEV